MIRSLLILSFFLSCAKTPVTTDRRGIDSRLTKYIIEFERLWRQKIPEYVKITMGKTSRIMANGQCNMSTKKIIINEDRWLYLSDTQKKIVVFHELGHCALDRGHLYYDDKRWKCGPSLMGWRGVSDECFHKYYDYYINELFTGCRKFKRTAR